jgi:hypothetical protein
MTEAATTDSGGRSGSSTKLAPLDGFAFVGPRQGPPMWPLVFAMKRSQAKY